MPRLGEFQPVPSVARQVRDEAGLGESLLQVIARLGLVFDDQDFHVQETNLDGCILPQPTPAEAPHYRFVIQPSV